MFSHLPSKNQDWEFCVRFLMFCLVLEKLKENQDLEFCVELLMFYLVPGKSEKM